MVESMSGNFYFIEASASEIDAETSRNMHMNIASSRVWQSVCLSVWQPGSLFVGVMVGFRKDLTVFVMHNFEQMSGSG